MSETNRTNNKPMRTSIVWLIGVTLLIVVLLYMALSQIKTSAEDNVPSSAEHAQCLADHDPASGVPSTEACPTEADVLFAARHPVRNTAIVGFLSFGLGYLYLIFHHSERGFAFFGSPLPDNPATRDRES